MTGCLRASSELGHATDLIPVRDVDVGLRIDVASVGGAKVCGGNVAGLQLVVCPLRLERVVTKESYRRVVAIEDGDSAFQFRDDGIFAMKADLAGAAEMLRDGADKL